MKFKLKSDFLPSDAQIKSISNLTKGHNKFPMQILEGITGSGKSFVVANLINNINKPTLVLAHNKTLAAQLYNEFKKMFPENRVEYFISYYDYYQPESYMPTTDVYIEKEVTVNEQIEKMRLKALSSILSRDDVIIVASISCIYGAGNPEDMQSLAFEVKVGDEISRSDLMRKLVDMQYERNDVALSNGNFRARGETIDVLLGSDDTIIRFDFFGDEVEEISEVHYITTEVISKIDKFKLYPAKQFVIPEAKVKSAIGSIKNELNVRLSELDLLESQRLRKKVNYDIELIEEMGYCSGIENYSRYFDNRKEGEPPFVLLDYFPKDFLLVIDESHQSIPQSNAMYKGDYSRKKNLIDFGFRLPSAYDNRPLRFEEFEKYFHHCVFMSATPGNYELEHAQNRVEQIIRPTGLLDPIVEVRESTGQVKDLISEIRKTITKKERILVTTLTKKMAEDLSEFLSKQNINVRYMHSDVDTLDRIELIRQLRLGDFDVLIGINLLREGLDIPEVSLICILDADKEGFLRNERSLIQTIGRASRNANGRVVMYANKMTDSMKRAIEKTKYRRDKQKEYNKKHNITPKTIIKKIDDTTANMKKNSDIKGFKHLSKTQLNNKIIEIDEDMRKAAESLDFEKAIELREAVKRMQKYVEYSER